MQTMLLRFFYLLSVVCVSISTASAQRLVGTDTLYGNEWIEDTDYLKVKVTDAGLYRVSQTELSDIGWGSVTGSELKLTFLGEEQSIFVSNSGSWSSDDFLFFYADEEKFAAYEDEIFVDGPNSNLNPDRKLFSDTMTLYLSMELGTRLRYSVKDPVAVAPTTFDTSLLVRALPTQTATVFHSRRINSDGAQSSRFDNGDGWVYRNGSSNRLNFVHQALDPNHELVFKAKAVSSTYGPVGVQRGREILLNGLSLFSSNSSANQVYEDELIVRADQLTSSTRSLIEIIGVANSSDRYAIGESALFYHRMTGSVSGGYSWRTSDLVDPVKWEDVDASNEFFVLDIDRGIIQGINPSIPFSDIAVNQISQRGIFFDNSDFGGVVLENFESRPLSGLSANYLIITSEKLNAWETNAVDYSNFRSDPINGGYSVAILEAEDLVDHFGYGVFNDPRSIRNAIGYYSNFGNAERVLILGKGRTFNQVRIPTQLSDSLNRTYFVPSFGIPASDNLLAFNPITKSMSAAIGRLSVQNSGQVEIAIDKARDETNIKTLPQTIADRFWTKQTVIISGGKEPGEQAFLKNYLLGFQDVLANSRLGVEYTGLHKTTTEPIQLTASDAYYQRVNEGVSLISFFGHAASSTLDVAVDDFTKYSNSGKYPLFVSLGCFAGDANSPSLSLSEIFVFEPDKSMSGFLASVGLSYPFSTADFTTQFYSNLANDFIGLPIGDALREVLNRELNDASFQMSNFAEQLMYQGDPAARLFIADGVDLIVNESATRVGPQPLVSNLDSFEVTFEVLNLGQADTNSFRVEWTRSVLSTGEEIKDTIDVLGGVSTRKSISFIIPSLYLDGGGLNQISFKILPGVQQSPVGSAEANDQSGITQFFVASSRVDILWPNENSVVPKQDMRLFIEHGSPWDGAGEFLVQIALDNSFNSIAEENTIQSKSLLEYQIQGDYSEGTVLYARAKVNADTVWSYRTFQVGENGNEYGRSLSTVDQFEKGETDQLRPLSTGGWGFGREQFIKILTTKQFDPNEEPPSFARNLETPYESVIPWEFLDGGIAILVADSITGDEFFNDPPQYGSVDCGTPNRAFAFSTSTPVERALVVDFLNTVPQDGEFVYVFTIYNDTSFLDPTDWALDTTRGYAESIPSVLSKLGAQQMSNWKIRGTVPYNFIYRHRSGFSSEVLDEQLGSTRDDIIVSTVALPLRRRFGTYRSPSFGGLNFVSQLTWVIDSTLADSSNTVEIDLVGFNSPDDETVLYTSNAFEGEFSFPLRNDHSFYRIDVRQQDDLNRKAMPIRSLKLVGEETVELAYDPNVIQEFQSEILQPTDSFSFAIGLRNVSPTVLDSFSTQLFEIETGNQFIGQNPLGQIDAWESKVWADTTFLGRGPSTKLLAFSINNQSTGKERAEVNNLSIRLVEVLGDEVSPSLKLFVDGEPILKNMLVSSEPIVELDLIDNVGVDTSASIESYIQLSLKSPEGFEFISNQNLLGSLEVVPSTISSKQKFLYTPGTLSQGVWELSAVVLDAYGNPSSTNPLTYSLEVDTTASISNFLPYPNPAVDRVFFTYELTGEVPLDYQIDIYTSSGRLVRSLNANDLGSLKIGRQLTDGYWDTTDNFGNKLARGVYLYRVSNDNSATNFGHRSSQIDSFVKSGFGKIVLIR